MKIRVASFDMDGCLLHRAKAKTPAKAGAANPPVEPYTSIIADNRSLLEGIKGTKHNYSETIIFLGTNRQSKAIDDLNAEKYEKGLSAIPAIKTVSEYLEATLDKFMMADLYGSSSQDSNWRYKAPLPSGTSFDQAIENTSAGVTHADWVFDESKASLIYAQMHKIASEHPQDTIVFDFYDDRGDILVGLNTFFSQHPELIPEKLTLQLHHYAGNTPIENFTIQEGANKRDITLNPIAGRGEVDPNYGETVRQMAIQAMKTQDMKAKMSLEMLQFTALVHPDKLQKRSNADAYVNDGLTALLNITRSYCSQLERRESRDSPLLGAVKHLKGILEAGNSDNTSKIVAFYQALDTPTTTHLTLTAQTTPLIETPISLIRNDNKRTNSEFLRNVGIVLSCLLIIPAVALGIYHALGGNAFQTKSSNESSPFLLKTDEWRELRAKLRSPEPEPPLAAGPASR